MLPRSPLSATGGESTSLPPSPTPQHRKRPISSKYPNIKHQQSPFIGDRKLQISKYYNIQKFPLTESQSEIPLQSTSKTMNKPPCCRGCSSAVPAGSGSGGGKIAIVAKLVSVAYVIKSLYEGEKKEDKPVNESSNDDPLDKSPSATPITIQACHTLQLFGNHNIESLRMDHCHF
ncbi:unnamed protein product [Ambrosiozyma monospora]|uniref:Unnamed protein product n=1 Tax=Ambrosiozyma monospora TaxID=43982 RepID=A0ACB5TSS7_AMBMO|nr:unnamed protein product [Ambrosiozyma monospora]